MSVLVSPVLIAPVFIALGADVASAVVVAPTVLLSDGSGPSPRVMVNSHGDVMALDYLAPTSRIRYSVAGGAFTTTSLPANRTLFTYRMLDGGAEFTMTQGGSIPTHQFAYSRTTSQLTERVASPAFPSDANLSSASSDAVLITGREGEDRGDYLLYEDHPFSSSAAVGINVTSITPATPTSHDIVSTGYDANGKRLIAVTYIGSTIYRQNGSSFDTLFTTAGNAQLIGTDAHNNIYYTDQDASDVKLYSTASSVPLASGNNYSLGVQVLASGEVLVGDGAILQVISPDGTHTLLQSTVTDGSTTNSFATMNNRGGVVFITRAPGLPDSSSGELWYYDGTSSTEVASGFGYTKSLALTDDDKAYFWTGDGSTTNQKLLFVVVPEPCIAIACPALLLATRRRRNIIPVS